MLRALEDEVGAAQSDSELTADQERLLEDIISNAIDGLGDQPIFDTLQNLTDELGDVPVQGFGGPGLTLADAVDAILSRRKPAEQPRFLLRVEININTGEKQLENAQRIITEPGGAVKNLIAAPDTLYRIDRVTGDLRFFDSTLAFTNPPGVISPIPLPNFVPLTGVDSDNDGIPDIGEEVIGTDPLNPDTDNDGISDSAEILGGTDPLDDKLVRTGIIASATTPGPALDVSASNELVAVATGDAGVSIFNVFNGMNPSIIGQVDTPGSAQAVAAAPGRIAVADGSSGVSILDTRDPTRASLTHQIGTGALRGNAIAIAAAGSIAYAGTDTGWVAKIDMNTGAILDYITLDGKSAHDLVVTGGFLFILDEDATLHIAALDQGLFEVGAAEDTNGTESRTTGRMRLFVGGGFAYITHSTGYNTVNVAEPLNPTTLVNTMSTQLDWKHVVINGSGLAVAVLGTSVIGPHDVSLFDSSDPFETTAFITEFGTPGTANAAAILNGLAYVADGASGLQVINYLAYDALGVPPTVTFTLPDLDGALTEGALVRVQAQVQDDVQVRNVQLLVDGNVVETDGNFPFEMFFRAPLMADQPTVEVTVVATDTGGNRAVADTQTCTLAADATPPFLLNSSPGDGFVGFDVTAVSLQFSESVLPGSLDTSAFLLTDLGPDGRLGSVDDLVVPLADVALVDNDRILVRPMETPLIPSVYRLDLPSTALTDLASNSLQNDLVIIFSSQDAPPEGTTAWVRGNGDWTNALNWSDGFPPANGDAVVIDTPGPQVTTTIPDFTFFTVSDLRVEEDLEVLGTLTVTGTGVFNGALLVDGRIIISGAGASLTINGDLSIAPGDSIELRDGATVNLAALTQLTDVNFRIDFTRGGLAEFPVLTTYTADGMHPEWTIAGNGTVLAPALTTMRNVDLSLFNGALVELPALQQITATDPSFGAAIVRLTSASELRANALSNIDNMQISIQSGSMFLLPSVLTYRIDIAGGTVLSVNGINSILDLPNLRTFTFDSGISVGTSIAIRAQSNGHLGLGALTNMVFPSPNDRLRLETGSNATTNLDFLVSGSNLNIEINLGGTLSLPNVDALDSGTVTVDSGGSLTMESLLTLDNMTTTIAGIFDAPNLDFIGASSLTVNSDLTLPNLVEVQGTDVTVTTTASLTLPMLTTMTSPGDALALFVVRGAGLFSAPFLTNIDGLQVHTTEGAQLTLDAVTSYAWGPLSSAVAVFQSSGAGGLLAIPNLETLSYDSGLAVAGNTGVIRAREGVVVDLPGLTTLTLVGPSDEFLISADGVDSVVDITNLETFDTGRVTFEELNGGLVIRMPPPPK